MVHVRFDPDSLNWKVFFASQQEQYGGSYFEGIPYQRGYGIGSVFKSLYRFLLPIGREIGREGLSVTSRLLDDLARGQNPKEALTIQTREGLKNLLKKGSDKLQEGSGLRKRIKSIKGKKKQSKDIPFNYRIVGRTVRRPIKKESKIIDYLNY